MVLGDQRRDVSHGQRAGGTDFVNVGNLERVVDWGGLLRRRDSRDHRIDATGEELNALKTQPSTGCSKPAGG